MSSSSLQTLAPSDPRDSKLDTLTDPDATPQAKPVAALAASLGTPTTGSHGSSPMPTPPHSRSPTPESAATTTSVDGLAARGQGRMGAGRVHAGMVTSVSAAAATGFRNEVADE
ncbi:hypothetical protein HDU96_008898, partial [Phlyctochytrium bullatum]